MLPTSVGGQPGFSADYGVWDSGLPGDPGSMIEHTVLNNGIAVSLVILATLTSSSGESQIALTSEQAQDGVIVGSALLPLSAPALAYFIYTSWPRIGARLPYLAEES